MIGIIDFSGEVFMRGPFFYWFQSLYGMNPKNPSKNLPKNIYPLFRSLAKYACKGKEALR